MSIIRALLAAGLTLGLSTHADATAEPTCSSILDVSIADPESPSPVELRQVAAAARTAIAAQHVKHADAFPAQSDGVVGMMKGGGLKTVGYSKHGHANEPKTFPDCLDACYDDCKCLAFHWSRKHARCGLKAEGDITVSTDNRYQKTFRSFKRVKGCTPATAEPTTTPATTTSSTTSTTAQPTTTTPPCIYKTGISNFEEAVDVFFNVTDGGEAAVGCPINTFDTSTETTFQNLFKNKAAFNQNVNGWATGSVTSMFSMFYQAAAFNQNINGFDTGAVNNDFFGMSYMFTGAVAFNQNINGWDTGNVVKMDQMFSSTLAFNQNINGWNTSKVTGTLAMFFLGHVNMTAAKMPDVCARQNCV